MYAKIYCKKSIKSKKIENCSKIKKWENRALFDYNLTANIGKHKPKKIGKI